MPEFLNTLHESLAGLGVRGCRVLVGVSGGADSVSLLRGLAALRSELKIELQAAHLNHALRPGPADEDAEWTRALAQRCGAPIDVERIDAGRWAREKGQTIEEAARTVRYAFFERLARVHACRFVAVAHTSDDRIETVLHHLLRGTGVAGLIGMRASRSLAAGISLVRPLLRVSRAAIEAWLAELGQDYRVDASNADTRPTRNRIRHVLLPALERDFGPKLRESILRLADQADEVQTALSCWAGRLLDHSLLDDSADVCRLSWPALEGEPRHVVREVFVELWKRKGWARRAMGFEDWDRLYRLAKEGGRATLPENIEATRRGRLLVLVRRGERGAD